MVQIRTLTTVFTGLVQIKLHSTIFYKHVTSNSDFKDSICTDKEVNNLQQLLLLIICNALAMDIPDSI